MIKIFNLSIKDFLSKKYILLSILPFIFSLLIMGVIAYFGGYELHDVLLKSGENSGYAFFNSAKYPKIFESINWLIGILISISGVFLVIVFSILIASIVAGFLTPIITKDINKKYYNIDKKNEVSTLRIIKISIIEFFKFLGILLICLPFLMVPIINLFVITIPFFYIYYKFLLIDVASNALDATKFEFSYKNGGGYSFMFASFIFYLVCLIPLAGILFQLFFVIYLTHLTYQKEQKMLNEIKF